MMPQRTQQSTTANQRAAPPGDRGDLTLVDLYNFKMCRGLNLQERAREQDSQIQSVGRAMGSQGETGMKTAMSQILRRRTSCFCPDLLPKCPAYQQKIQPRMFTNNSFKLVREQITK